MLRCDNELLELTPEGGRPPRASPFAALRADLNLPPSGGANPHSCTLKLGWRVGDPGGMGKGMGPLAEDGLYPPALEPEMLDCCPVVYGLPQEKSTTEATPKQAIGSE